MVRKVDPHAPEIPHPGPQPAPPRSPQVEGQGHGEDDPRQHEERQPGLQEGPAAGGRRGDTAVSDAPVRQEIQGGPKNLTSFGGPIPLAILVQIILNILYPTLCFRSVFRLSHDAEAQGEVILRLGLRSHTVARRCTY